MYESAARFGPLSTQRSFWLRPDSARSALEGVCMGDIIQRFANGRTIAAAFARNPDHKDAQAMNKRIPMDTWDCEDHIDRIISDYDDTCMPMPDIEYQPHLLISKVRKHYMEYIIKLLTLNYETNQKLLNKNIYLPSAIWRCAKYIELSAAQTSMVVQLYRSNIIQVITDLKRDTTRGKLNKKLYECLRNVPLNEKKIQTTLERSNNCTCKCTCSQRKRRRLSDSLQMLEEKHKSVSTESLNTANVTTPALAIPFNVHPSTPAQSIPIHVNPTTPAQSIPIHVNPTTAAQSIPAHVHPTTPAQSMPVNANLTTPVLATPVQTLFNCPAPQDPQKIINQPQHISPSQPPRMSVESHESDDIISKMEQMYKDLPNEDDIFEGTFCDFYDSLTHDDNSKKLQAVTQPQSQNIVQGTIIEDHAAQIKSLDERLASLTGLIVNNNNNNETMIKNKPETKERKHNKWLCEQYFLKLKLYEQLDLIRDTNRKKFLRIKQKFNDLFGEDSDDEDVVSPMEETPEFIRSCKDRIAPWLLKILTPHYVSRRIRGKAVFKDLAKHLLKTIYTCSRYPSEYEVTSFVNGFLESRKVIRCEADFKDFRIENLVTNRL